MAIPTDPTFPAPTVCALCDQRAVARLSVDWLCADHVLIELANRAGAAHV